MMGCSQDLQMDTWYLSDMSTILAFGSADLHGRAHMFGGRYEHWSYRELGIFHYDTEPLQNPDSCQSAEHTAFSASHSDFL